MFHGNQQLGIVQNSESKIKIRNKNKNNNNPMQRKAKKYGFIRAARLTSANGSNQMDVVSRYFT